MHIMSASNKPVLSYAEFLSEKVDPNLNLDALKVKGKSFSKEVKPELSDIKGKDKGKKVSSEVKPKLSVPPANGKKSSKEVSSNLSNLKHDGGKRLKAELDPKFAKMPVPKSYKKNDK